MSSWAEAEGTGSNGEGIVEEFTDRSRWSWEPDSKGVRDLEDLSLFVVDLVGEGVRKKIPNPYPSRGIKLDTNSEVNGTHRERKYSHEVPPLKMRRAKDLEKKVNYQIRTPYKNMRQSVLTTVLRSDWNSRCFVQTRTSGSLASVRILAPAMVHPGAQCPDPRAG